MQAEAMLQIADSNKRVVILGAPTGFGKSLSYTASVTYTGRRTCALTATKALMRQVSEDYVESGMIEIRGLNSYICNEGGPTGMFGDMRREGWRADRGLPMMADEAPCQAGAFCPKREGGCNYYDAYRAATSMNNKLIVTNYAYWMSIHKFSDGLNPMDMLICDEAHEALDELGKFVGTELRPHELELLVPGAKSLATGADIMDWKAWGLFWNDAVMVLIDELKHAIKETERLGTNRTGQRLNYAWLRRMRDLKRVQHKLSTIATMQGEWVIDYVEDSGHRPLIKFDPVSPGEYAERYLFRNINKIVLVSATVRPETAYKLGFSPDEVDFKEYPSPIPKASRPIIIIPTAHMSKSRAAEGKREWSLRMDQIIGRRLDRKGIIHTVSYPRSREVFMNSEYKEIMMTHDHTNTAEVIDRFKKGKPPLVMVSPVLDTGYDFPFTQAEYQIISKMPFPVTVDKVMKARTARDKGYRDYVTMIKLVQMAGRIVRAEQDRGETFIIDSDFIWWWKAGWQLVPLWFKEALRYEDSLGVPLPKLTA